MPSILNSDDGVVSGTSGLKTTGGNDGLLNIQTNGSTAISISSGQRSTFPTTIGVGNATPSTSGSGITFPATQSASSDANTLDDYEEGTWTPQYGATGSDPTVAYSGQNGRYVKIGNTVFLSGRVQCSSITGGSGTLTLKNFPFTAGGFGSDLWAVSFGVIFGGWGTNNAPAAGFVSASTTSAILKKYDSGDARDQFDTGVAISNTVCGSIFTITYTV